jgi:hypothetical protein
MKKPQITTVNVCIAAIVAILGYAAYSDIQWYSFSQQHACQVVGEESPTYGFSGSRTFVVAGKTTYSCNDGKTYTR